MLMKLRAAYNGTAYPHIAEVSQKADNNTSEPDHSVVGGTEVSSYYQACQGRTNQCQSPTKAGIEDVAKCLGFGNGHLYLGNSSTNKEYSSRREIADDFQVIDNGFRIRPLNKRITIPVHITFKGGFSRAGKLAR